MKVRISVGPAHTLRSVVDWGRQGCPERIVVRTELVGREAELGVLVETLEGALANRPQVVLCQGEPGIGKTRLVDELVEVAAAGGALCAST